MPFESISYQKKCIALGVLTLCLGIGAYKRSFRLAYDAYQNYEQAQAQLEHYNTASRKVQFLKNEIDLLDQLIGKQSISPNKVQHELLHFYTQHTKDVNLKALGELHESQNNYFKVYTNQLYLEGASNSLLALTYDYEKHFEYSRIVSLSFELKKELKTKKYQLIEQIIFQNYEKVQ